MLYIGYILSNQKQPKPLSEYPELCAFQKKVGSKMEQNINQDIGVNVL